MWYQNRKSQKGWCSKKLTHKIPFLSNFKQGHFWCSPNAKDQAVYFVAPTVWFLRWGHCQGGVHLWCFGVIRLRHTTRIFKYVTYLDNHIVFMISIAQKCYYIFGSISYFEECSFLKPAWSSLHTSICKVYKYYDSQLYTAHPPSHT